ncbi:MAG: radical SAM protein [bacterium]
MQVAEIAVKHALVRSRIPGVDYVINPYLGCQHGCRYCYAQFMTKYSKINSNAVWGDFVEVKTNIAQVLRADLSKKRKTGKVHISSVCDAYQPLEEHYKLTRECLLVLREYGWEIGILTRSPLVLRDIDILKSSLGSSVGMSVPTDDDKVRQITEPHAPSIESRIDTLRKLREAGIQTWAFIAPLLPMNPQRLCDMLVPHVGNVMIDRMNYSYMIAELFRERGWLAMLSPKYQDETAAELTRLFQERGVQYQ